MTYSATYDPTDNKLRLYSVGRLPRDVYDRVKAAGFSWAPKQELFVAPGWTPQREDLLLELCGEIGDEDTSLVDRAEVRADRFEDYSEKRQHDANGAYATASAIGERFAGGQPILVGHHSERKARKDKERIENNMRRAVNLWKTSTYWADRAAGALSNAKYRESRPVRARRIKGLEADLRKYEKQRNEAQTLIKLWSDPELTYEKAIRIANYDHGSYRFPLAEHPRNPPASQYEGNVGLWSALTDGMVTWEDFKARVIPRVIASKQGFADWQERWITHTQNRLAYERALLGEQGGLITDAHDLQPGGQVLIGDEWLTIVRVNKKDGRAVSVTTNARYCRVRGTETVRDYRPPTEELAAKVKAATKLPPMCNYPMEGATVGACRMGGSVSITKAEWDARHKDYKGSSVLEANEKHGRHRIRTMVKGGMLVPVFITDQKRVDPPKPETVTSPAETPELPAPEYDLATMERNAEKRAAFREKCKAREESPFAKMEEALRQGVQVVSAPQLFPTPAGLAARVVELAEIGPDHRILEPSAGTGNLIHAIGRQGMGTVAVELNCRLAELLRGHFPGMLVCNTDFLELDPGDLGPFDRIVMNPPFENGSDIKHVEHARRFLAPGGRLVAIVANGPRQRERWESTATEWHDLPEGSFKEAGTNVRTAIVVFDAE